MTQGEGESDSDEIKGNWLVQDQDRGDGDEAEAEIINPHMVHRVERSAGESALGIKGRTV